jgi:hypothetical protein
MIDVAVKLPAQKREVLVAVVDALKNASNVVAVVLGGSYARGVAREDSDLDIGIYYRESAPLPVQEVRSIAESICTPGTIPVVTDLYGWGPWVNGGAWIQTPATKVDFIYRNLDQVRGVLEEGSRGVWRHDFDQQPPYGFRSVVYFGETRFCIPLYDPVGEIRDLKTSVATYPELLKSRIVQDSLWGAEFSMWSCDRFATSTDVYNATGCMTRAAQFLVHAIFALNEEYFLSDKHVTRNLAQLPKRPHNCVTRLEDALSSSGRTASQMRSSLASLWALWADVVKLTDGAYLPRFDLTAALTARSMLPIPR